MWKWIGGGCLLIVVLIVVLIYAGYRKMSNIAATGPSVSVNIAATPNRVFASLANADSLKAWQFAGGAVHTSRAGALAVGDTIYQPAGDSVKNKMVWIVESIVPDQVLATKGVSITNGSVFARRRDSVFAVGDSTTVTSTLSFAMMDSLSTEVSKRGGMAAGVASMASTMGMAGMKMQAELELKNLKRHIESKAPVVRPDSR